MTSRFLAGACALACAFSPALVAQASFTMVPEGTAFTDLTPDGQAAVLHNYFTGEAWVWTAAGGLQPIGSGDVISAEGISADGSIVSGTLRVAGQEVAARWTAAGGWELIGGLPGEVGCDAFLSAGFDASGDGLTHVGLAWEGCKGRAFRWTAGTGLTELQQFGPGSSRANAISQDGLTIGGWDEDAAGPRRPALWLPDGSHVILGPPDVNGEVQVLSDDGRVAAGDVFDRAYYWTEETGMVDLGLLPGGFGFELSGTYAMTGDGRMLGGSSGNPGPFGSGVHAWVWTEASGMEGLAQRLKAEGAPIPDSFRPGNVLGISDDGRTVVGWGMDLSGFGEQRAYIATLAPQAWFVAGDGLPGAAGEPDLAGSGPQTAKSRTTLAIRNGAPEAVAYLVAGLSRADVPLKGGVLVPNPDMVLAVQLDGSGARDVVFRWPEAVPPGTEAYWQAWVSDASGAQGYAATNGLMSVTP